MKAVPKLSIGVVVDERARAGLKGSYGLSLYLQTDSWRALVDVGPSDEVLAHNAKLMGIDLSKLDFVVITHDHPDHTGGLNALRDSKRAVVYIPAGSSWRLQRAAEDLGLTVRRALSGGEIAPGAFLLGQQYGPPYEHALAVNLAGLGLVTVHGCSHPGPSRITAKAYNDTGVRPFVVVGGLHLAWSDPAHVASEVEKMLSLGVRLLVPLHCSGELVVEEAARRGIVVRRAIAGDWIELPEGV
ncbi:MAG: MBL fold metallo-hydrolase [Acidilobus sp.]